MECMKCKEKIKVRKVIKYPDYIWRRYKCEAIKDGVVCGFMFSTHSTTEVGLGKRTTVEEVIQWVKEPAIKPAL